MEEGPSTLTSTTDASPTEHIYAQYYEAEGRDHRKHQLRSPSSNALGMRWRIIWPSERPTLKRHPPTLSSASQLPSESRMHRYAIGGPTKEACDLKSIDDRRRIEALVAVLGTPLAVPSTPCETTLPSRLSCHVRELLQLEVCWTSTLVVVADCSHPPAFLSFPR